MNKIIFCFQLSIHILCLVHISQILMAMIYPEEPNVRTYQKNIQDIEFPMTFRICMEFREDGIDSILRNLGYENIRGYFIGISFYNKSIIGWAGHAEDGNTIGSVEGLGKTVKMFRLIILI